MSNYNPYADYKCFNSNYDLRNEAIPAMTCFSSFPNEVCLYQNTEVMPYPAVINNVVSNNITAFDKKVISLTATYGFITSKQVSECLTLMGTEYSDNILKSSLDRLKRNNILRACRFGSDNDHCAKFYVYSLNKNGSDIAKVLGIPHTYAPMQPATEPAEIKKILATNQVMLAYIKSGLKLDWMKRGQVISAKEEKSVVVRPSMAVSVNGDTLFIEVVRQGEFWKQYLMNKFQRYKLLLENWSSNNWNLSEKPILVLNGENLEHNRLIAQLIAEFNLEVYFTEDTLNCGANFYHSLYQLMSDSEPEYFCFEQKERAA